MYGSLGDYRDAVIITCKCYVVLVSRLNGGEEKDRKMKIKLKVLKLKVAINLLSVEMWWVFSAVVTDVIAQNH